MKIKTGNHGFLKRQNLSGVFQHLYENAPVSRIELSRLTGLNKATVTNLVNELIGNGYVREVGETADRRAGRREVLLDLDPRRGYFLSAEIGVGFVSVVCTNFAAEVVWKRRARVENLEPEFLLKETLALLKEAARAGGDEKSGSLEGLAVGIPGLIDQKSGTLLFAPNLGWRDVGIVSYFEKHFAGRIFIDNEATFAALGEKFFGAARGFNNVLYISAGVGIGGGLILNGQLYNGASGFAGEFGHMTMDPGGEPCACGSAGCWETQASQSALVREVSKKISGGEASSLKSLSGSRAERISLEMIVEAARANDAVARASLETIGSFLGLGMDALIKAFNPEAVVFGGNLSLAGEYILPAIKKELNERGLLESAGQTKVLPAKFGSDAAVMGGVAKILQTILAAPAENPSRKEKRPAGERPA